jgi:energy-coupling factor transporter ATP-binding protein EcfA2
MPEEPKSPKETDPVEEIKQKFKEIALSWGLPGLIVGLAMHFAKEQKWDVAIFLTITAGLVALLAKFFDKLSPHIDKLFEWLANNFAGWVQRLWWKLTAQFQGRYYESLVFACRNFRTQGLKTKGSFTLDLEKVFVPLRVAPESPDRVMAGMLQSRGTSEELKIWNFLADLKKQPAFRRIVVIAPPGAGKSTLLEHLALTYAHNTQRRQHRRAPRLIPVLLYLRNVRETISSAQPPDLATLIEQQESIKTLNPQGWFKRNLNRGKCLVMLDGLDEVADEEQRQKVSQWVDRQMQLYPKTPFILTSRPFGYRSAPLEQVGTVLEVKPFSLQEMKQFVNNWYLQQEIMNPVGKDDQGVRDCAARQSENLIGRIQNTPTLAAMALNPLLLTMIATVHRFRGVLPGGRVELYHEICDVLLGRRQDAKKIPDTLKVTQKKVVLQVLALGLMKQQTREFTPELGAQLIQDKLRDIGGYEANAKQFLKQVENTSGLLVEKEQGVYEFAHKSFQEYLAAVELASANQPEILIGKIEDAWWDETIRLYAAQADATYLVEAALQNATVTALTLASDCVEGGLNIHPDVRKALEDKLTRGLESVDADLFKLAAEVKLARRLKDFIRIDEKTEIDNSLITCAEYQLFIDEKLKENNYCQPDHWTDRRFRTGGATKPITGVRASDAEEFCQWLTDRSTTKYRLLTLAEAEKYPISLEAIGYWYNSKDSKKVMGISPQYWKNWSQTFFETRDRELSRDRKPVFSLCIDLFRRLVHNHNHNHDPDLAKKLAYYGNHDHDCDLFLNLDLDDCDLLLDLFLDRDRDLFLDCDLLRDRDYDYDHDLRNIKKAEARITLFTLALAWNSLLKTYLIFEQKQNRVWVKETTRKQQKELTQKYAQWRDAAYRIYKFYVLVEERQAGNLPAWEGIRIVGEQILD